MLKRKQLLDASKCRRMKCEECSMNLLCSDAERFETEELAQTALNLLDMLKRCASEEAIVCPICGIEVHLYGHTNDCELNNLLKEVEG